MFSTYTFPSIYNEFELLSSTRSACSRGSIMLFLISLRGEQYMSPRAGEKKNYMQFFGGEEQDRDVGETQSGIDSAGYIYVHFFTPLSFISEEE